jgi:hypothetical protein
MFDTFISSDSIEAFDGPDGTTGYRFQTRIPYYRGLGLSMVESVAVKVDNVPIEPSNVRFAVHGNEYRLDELGAAVNDRWGFTEDATVSILQGLDLSPGQHDVELRLGLRISYIPWPSASVEAKQMLFESPSGVTHQ